MARGASFVVFLMTLMVTPSVQQRVIDVEKGTLPIDQTAYYDITFTNNWTRENHPKDYPAFGAHWSPPVVVSHVRSYSLWRARREATEAIQIVAETGFTGALSRELSDLQSGVGRQQRVLEFAVGSNIFGNEPSTVATRLEFTRRFRFASLISMVAPSPDWFTGFHNIAPFEDGVWHDSFRVVLYPYDAGTDSGTTYRAPNSATVPKQNISRIRPRNAPDGIFLHDYPDNERREILPLGYVDFKRVV